MLYAFCPQLMFTGHRSINSQGFIAIDDITVREGACSDQGMLSDTNHLLMLRGKHQQRDYFNFGLFFNTILDVCGFDSSLCGFIDGVSHFGRWVQKKATKSEVDHTYGTENGESCNS